MPDHKQLYTVKRIPPKGDVRVTTWQILGPGAPEKPIAVEPIAIMIRDALEEAGQVLVKQTIAKCKNEILERNPVEPFKLRDALRIEHPLTGLPSDIHLITGDEVNIAAAAYRAALAQVDEAASRRADHTQDLIASAPSKTSTLWEVYGLPDPEVTWFGETFTKALLDQGGECDSCGTTVPSGDLQSVPYGESGNSVADGDFCSGCRGGSG